MDQLNLLGVAMGLACLAGINLYLTVFVTGLAIQQHWIVLAPAYRSLEILGHPAIVWIAGLLYVLEFFADKIPWVDSIWDALHTIIRPIGGALLAIQVLGSSSPALNVIVALLAGGTSLMTHTSKAATRLVANTSPEPFSNIALSLAEDAGVLGGLALIHYSPLLALGVFLLLAAVFAYIAPKLLRAMKTKIWLAWKKLNSPAATVDSGALPGALPGRLAAAFAAQNVLGATIAWAVPCVSGKARRIPANLFGALVATHQEPHRLYFVARRGWGTLCETIELQGYEIAHQSEFLCERLVLHAMSGAKGPAYFFVFERARAIVVELVAASLRERLRSHPAAEEATSPAGSVA